MNSAEGNIADFFAEVLVMFDAEAQYTKLQEQLRTFSARIGAITIPVRLTGLNDASLEMSAMRDFGAPAGRRRAGGLTENQWESQTTRSMLAQGYAMGEGGWYKPEGGSTGSRGVDNAAERSGKGLGMLSGLGGTLGFAGSMAGFMGVFAAVGDLVQGAHLAQQEAVLRQLIPNQQQYTQALSTISEVANTAGINIMDATHSFVTFSNAAQVAGISADQTNQSFKALTYAIAGTGSQSQAGRIFGDFSHMVLNSSQISMAQIQKSDLGRYLAIPQLLEQLPQFKGDDVKQLSEAFNKLSKAQQLTLINTVLLERYQSLAAASADTTAGRFVVLENELKNLGKTISKTSSPGVNTILDIASVVTAGIRTGVNAINWGSLVGIDWLQKEGQKSDIVKSVDNWISKAAIKIPEGLYRQFNYKPGTTPNTQPQKIDINLKIENKSNQNVTTSVNPVSTQSSRITTRTQ